MNPLVTHYCDCDHLRMEPGAPLYQRETVYLASEVDALLRQREEEVVKRMTAWNTLRDGYDESIAQLQSQLAASQKRCAQLEEALKQLNDALDAMPYANSTLTVFGIRALLKSETK